MKRILIAAGIGLVIVTVTMSTVSEHRYMSVKDYENVNDTTPKKKKDTTKPKPDSPQVNKANLPY